MDPNVNLEEQRRIAARLVEAFDNERALDPHDVARLGELVIALDEWITRGGFLPDAWKRRSGAMVRA